METEINIDLGTLEIELYTLLSGTDKNAIVFGGAVFVRVSALVAFRTNMNATLCGAPLSPKWGAIKCHFAIDDQANVVAVNRSAPNAIEINVPVGWRCMLADDIEQAKADWASAQQKMQRLKLEVIEL